ncbi:hypothetical protein DFP72DRAFT_907529 [Ephemerocybe angulata]|uniref:Uncharacterized protein n=1 Tax=Ephemerocybe angulata TaxID=980116 RepID=A0A8H6HRH5_9AGAR|nr:hypothetical protein DFP72DRAFT_907529 [Tulosesus angulatus]
MNGLQSANLPPARGPHPTLRVDTTFPSRSLPMPAPPEPSASNAAHQPETNPPTSLVRGGTLQHRPMADNLAVQLFDGSSFGEETRPTVTKLVELVQQNEPHAVYWADLLEGFDRLWDRYNSETNIDNLRKTAHFLRMHATFLSTLQDYCLRNGRQDIKDDMANIIRNVNQAVSEISV